MKVHRGAVLAVALLLAGCERPAVTPDTGGEPVIRATVVTIRTTFQPEKEVVEHEIVIAGNRVRSTAERDVWRLIDTADETVTYIDEIARTVRMQPIAASRKERREATAGSLPSWYPQVALKHEETTRPILGTTARLARIEAGGYRRELWFGRPRTIPPRLFAMLVATEPASSPLAPMMREAEEALLEVEDFPLLDRTELRIGEQRKTIHRAVVSIASRDVPLSLVTRPRGFTDLTPPK